MLSRHKKKWNNGLHGREGIQKYLSTKWKVRWVANRVDLVDVTLLLLLPPQRYESRQHHLALLLSLKILP